MRQVMLLSFLILSLIIGISLIGVGLTGRVISDDPSYYPQVCKTTNDCSSSLYCCKPDQRTYGFCLKSSVCQESLNDNTYDSWTYSIEKAEKKDANNYIITGIVIVFLGFIMSYFYVLNKNTRKIKSTKKRKR